MTTNPIRAGMSLPRLARITDHLQSQYIDAGRIAGCQTLVARRGEVLHFVSQGLMDRERARPVRDDTIWRIYSMTKPITSVALMMLYEEGRFALDDPVHKFTSVVAWTPGLGERRRRGGEAQPHQIGSIGLFGNSFILWPSRSLWRS